jgi:biopolymer transport protein ExbB
MDGFMTFVHNYKLVDGLIVLLGLMGIAVISDRFRALYRTLAAPKEFFPQVMALMAQKEHAKASALCAGLKGKPLAEVLRRVIDNAHLNPDELEKTFSVAVSEVLPNITRRLGFLSMIANVVTMVGLLGTVMGLIISFQAVSMADASQKQTLLAQGISMAMHATALGLLVAIPVMIGYSFLAEKQMHLVSELEHKGQEMLEFLRAQDRAEWGVDKLFPATPDKKNTAPPAPHRAHA